MSVQWWAKVCSWICIDKWDFTRVQESECPLKPSGGLACIGLRGTGLVLKQQITCLEILIKILKGKYSGEKVKPSYKNGCSVQLKTKHKFFPNSVCYILMKVTPLLSGPTVLPGKSSYFPHHPYILWVPSMMSDPFLEGWRERENKTDYGEREFRKL